MREEEKPRSTESDENRRYVAAVTPVCEGRCGERREGRWAPRLRRCRSSLGWPSVVVVVSLRFGPWLRLPIKIRVVPGGEGGESLVATKRTRRKMARAESR